ncbi:hypothetical protein JB92DRAFT_3120700 [Gautieria morchelliformis]|nr:hypothetical protein JB92DRAFT_3120700 [Gautieria morchelliformis]
MPSAFGMMSLSLPLTRAFRKSDDSKYSEDSDEIDDEADEGAAYLTHLSVVTSLADIDHDVSILNESPVSDKSPGSRPWSPADDMHLRVASPRSHQGSVPPSTPNPSFPPSPSNMVSFTSTAPLTIVKGSPVSSPSTPRHPVSPPAISFTGVPLPGHPLVHMQCALHPCQYPPRSSEDAKSHRVGISIHSTLSMISIRPLKPSEYDPPFAGCLYVSQI